MRRLFIVCMFLSTFVRAQDTLKKAPAYFQREDLGIFNLTFDNWTNLPKDIESKQFRSRGFSFLFMTEAMNKSHNVGIGAGLGFMSQNVHTNAYIVDTGSGTLLSPIPDSVDLEVNKLSSNFITGAVELRLRSNENKSGEHFKLSVGFQAGYLLQSHVKYEDKNGKYKTYDIAHLNKFQYGIEGRIGYNKVAINGYYSLVPVFEDGKGPEMTPYSIGISLTL